jgi:hypothetical protein
MKRFAEIVVGVLILGVIGLVAIGAALGPKVTPESCMRDSELVAALVREPPTLYRADVVDMVRDTRGAAGRSYDASAGKRIVDFARAHENEPSPDAAASFYNACTKS